MCQPYGEGARAQRTVRNAGSWSFWGASAGRRAPPAAQPSDVVALHAYFCAVILINKWNNRIYSQNRDYDEHY